MWPRNSGSRASLMCWPHLFVDLGREIGPYSHYGAPGCIGVTRHPDPCGERGREQDAPIENHWKGSVDAELHRSGHVLFPALFQGNTLFSSRSAPFEAHKASLESWWVQESSGVTQTALICFVYFITNSELRRRRFRSIPRNPISYVNTVDFPHNPDLLRTGASVKNWCQTDILPARASPCLW